MSGLTVRLEDRIGLHERECRAWVERLRTDRRSAARVADELEWAVEAASAADQITSATDDSLSRLRELESEVARLLVERDAAERERDTVCAIHGGYDPSQRGPGWCPYCTHNVELPGAYNADHELTPAGVPVETKET